ncbi:MAG: SpoIIE family protein phosphatase [Spirochaetes bacterium]|nr:SpoIIE family protein phosphatase [Spirochaetota bacterium]
MVTSGETKKKSSIVTSLTLWYIGLTVVNIGVFWVGAGSNQMRLISEKATISARSVAYEVLRRVQPYIDAAKQQKNPADEFSAAQNRFDALLKNGKPRDILPGYRIVSSASELIYPTDKKTGKKGEATAKEILDSLKALQLKEIKNEMFIGVPDLVRREIDLYVPLTSGGTNDLILVSRVPLPDIEKEISGLIRLGIGMVVLLLALQTGMGFLIYRNFVVPIKGVGAAALRLSAGNFDQIENKRPKDDEINQLINSFNTMSFELKKNRDIMQLELNIARKIQASILPQTLKAGRLVAHIHYNPLQTVSGDYYDFLELSDGSIAIFIGDASGHGVPAAFITVMAKVYFTSLVEKISSPAELLSAMNDRMAAYFAGAGLYLTAFYLRIYPDGKSIYCNALHPDPIILRANGETDLLKASGFYVGMLKKVFRKYEDVEITLNNGDRLVLYTDGLTEAMNTESAIFSAERLIALTENNRGAGPADIIQNTIREVAEHQGDAKRQDDETLIVVEIGESGLPVAAATPAGVTEKHTPLEFEKSEKYTTAFETVSKTAGPETPVWRIRRSTENYLKKKELFNALAGFVILNQRKAGDANVLFHIGLTLYGLKFFKDSIVYLDLCLATDARMADAHWLRGLCLIKLRSHKKALSSVQAALAEKPDDERYLATLQKLQGGKG